MSIGEYKIQLEFLSEDEIQRHLEYSRDDFSSRFEIYIKDYSEKLSRLAFFVTVRNFENRIIGIVAFYANRLPEAFISHVWVSPDMRGEGICGKMIQLVTQFCISKRFSHISLEVRNDNHPAIAAYVKNGFNVVASIGDKSKMTKKLQ